MGTWHAAADCPPGQRHAPASEPRFAADGYTLRTTRNIKGSQRVWDADDSRALGHEDMALDPGSVYTRWTLGDHVFVVADGQGLLRAWDRRRRDACHVLRGHESAVSRRGVVAR